LPKSELPDVKKTLKQGAHILIPLLLLIYLIANNYPIRRAVLYTLFVALILSFFNRKSRLTILELLNTLVETMKDILPVSAACIAAGIISAIIVLTGLGLKVSSSIIAISGGSVVVALFLTMLVTLILGLGLIPTSAYIVGASVAAPALIKLGVMPLQAHLFIFYFACLGVITPPVCLGAYVAAGIAKCSPYETGLTAFSLGLVAFIVPFLFVGNPELLLGGIAGSSVWAIVKAIATATIGTIALAIGLRGYFLKPMNIVERSIMFISGISMVDPRFYTDLIGLFFITVVVAYHIKTSKNNKKSTK